MRWLTVATWERTELKIITYVFCVRVSYASVPVRVLNGFVSFFPGPRKACFSYFWHLVYQADPHTQTQCYRTPRRFPVAGRQLRRRPAIEGRVCGRRANAGLRLSRNNLGANAALGECRLRHSHPV